MRGSQLREICLLLKSGRGGGSHAKKKRANSRSNAEFSLPFFPSSRIRQKIWPRLLPAEIAGRRREGEKSPLNIAAWKEGGKREK